MKQFIAELKSFGLQEEYIYRLEFYEKMPGEISICCLINDIIHNYHAIQEIEDRVEVILREILKQHFNP